jgi:hypothetical protein
MVSDIRTALTNLDLALPSQEGDIAEKNGLKVSYMVVPKSQDTGCIEHDCLLSSTFDANIVGCVNAFHDAVENHSEKRAPNKSAKLKVHAMIATSKKPDATLGQSVSAGVWNFDKHPLSEIRDFVRNMRNSI